MHLSSDQVSSYLGGTLSDAEAATLEAHIDGCAACRELISETVRARYDEHVALASTHLAETPLPAAAGDVIDGRYRVERLLGVGGMGCVFEAHHLALNQRVALKFMLPQYARDRSAVDRFTREARAAVRLVTEHVGRVLDLGALPDGTPFLVMELLVGETVEHRLQREGPFPRKVALESVQDADHFTVMDRVEPRLEVVLPRQPSAEPLLFNELTPRQLQLLRVLATAPNLAGGNVSNALRDRRVPCGGEQLRMFLGLGACDRGHESRTFQLPDGETRYWPLWRFVIALARNAAWVAPGAEELARHFSTRELLSGWGELDAAIRLAWGGGEGWGYFERAIASRLGREPELPVIPLVSAFERTPREVREALWDVWATLQEGGRVADVVLVAALDHAPPRLPWVEALVAARPPLEREALVLAALRRAPAGDLRALGSEVGHPEPVRGPWRYLELALTEAVACAVFDVLERVHAWDVPLAEVLRFLARLPEATLDRLERPGVAVMLRRARWVRDGGQRTSDELARDLQAWFREGVTLESGESPGSPAPTCASCAAVFRYLGLDAEGLGAGAVGGVRSGSDDWPRTRGFVQGHWQTGGLVEVATGEGPHHPTVEAAILAATTGGNAVDRGCVELAALSAFAARLEQWYRELHQHLQTG